MLTTTYKCLKFDDYLQQCKFKSVVSFYKDVWFIRFIFDPSAL